MEYLLVKRKSKKDNKDTKIKKMKRTLKWGFFRKAAEVLMSSRFFLPLRLLSEAKRLLPFSVENTVHTFHSDSSDSIHKKTAE